MCGRQTSPARLLLCAALPRITFRFSLVHRGSHWQAHNQRLHLRLHHWQQHHFLYRLPSSSLGSKLPSATLTSVMTAASLSTRVYEANWDCKIRNAQQPSHTGQSQQWSHGGFEASPYFEFGILGQGVVLEVSSSISTRVRRNVKW